MEEDPEREKFTKAKIEEPNVELPKARLKSDSDPLKHLCYIKIFDGTQNAQEIAETDASGAKLERKVYRIRNKELVKVSGEDFEGMMEIQRVSKARIGILANAESNLHSHSFLDLVGSIEEVQTAEELILDKILKTYSSLIFPIILMPPTVYGDTMIIPLHKVVGVLGTSNSNLLWIEMESGAWIKIEPGPPSAEREWERVVRVFGPKENVSNAIALILSVMSDQPGTLYAAEALNELLDQLKEPTCLDLIKADERRSRFKKIKLKMKKKKEEINSEEEEEDNWRHLFERKKAVHGDSSSRSDEEEEEDEFKERKYWSQTYLREKTPSDRSKQSDQGEFKVPTWSERFGDMKSGVPEKGKKEAEGGGSGELERGKSTGGGGFDVPEKKKVKKLVIKLKKPGDGVSQSEGSKEAEGGGGGGSGVPEKEKKEAEEGGSGEDETEKQEEGVKVEDHEDGESKEKKKKKSEDKDE